MNANIAAAKGIDPCPMCGSDDVRWRKRRPTDFVLTWMRWAVEMMASLLRGGSRRRQITTDYSLYGDSPLGRAEMHDELREAASGHKTPRQFWRCKACNREGHVF